jgi:hypothetical protein
MPDDPRCHTLSWFEIPLHDLARAEALYGEARDPRGPRDAMPAVALHVDLGGFACMSGRKVRCAALHARA